WASWCAQLLFEASRVGRRCNCWSKPCPRPNGADVSRMAIPKKTIFSSKAIGAGWIGAGCAWKFYDLAMDASEPQSNWNSTMKPVTSNQRILCLWLPSWPLQRMRLARPELKRCELALYDKIRGNLRVV